MNEFSQVRILFVFKDGADLHDPQHGQIRPTTHVPIIQPFDVTDRLAGFELGDARWWLIPLVHKKSAKAWKPMCTNARADTVATTTAFRGPYTRCAV